MPYDKLDWLVDRAHIADAVTRVYSTIDDGDFVTPINAVWSSGPVILDYGTPKDTTGKDIQDTWQRQLGALCSAHHVITGLLVSLVSPGSATSVPTTASVRANVLASLTKDTKDAPLHQNGGVVHIKLAREGNDESNPWRITHFKARCEYLLGIAVGIAVLTVVETEITITEMLGIGMRGCDRWKVNDVVGSRIDANLEVGCAA